MASSLPAPSDPRTFRRLTIELEVTLQSDSNFYLGLTQNLSEGGVFLATHLVKAMGTKVEMVLRLGARGVPLQLKGRVRWVREFSEGLEAAPGMGIEFEDLSDEDARAIAAFLATRTPLFFDMS